MQIETFDITGFGGGYEATCQQMLWNAVRFISEGDRNISSKQSPQIYGIAINEGEDGKAFDDAMMDGIEGATGAMHHCATNHALYIQKNGYLKWFQELKAAREKDGEKPYLFNYPHEFKIKE